MGRWMWFVLGLLMCWSSAVGDRVGVAVLILALVAAVQAQCKVWIRFIYPLERTPLRLVLAVQPEQQMAALA
jgi:hypothetical protein